MRSLPVGTILVAALIGLHGIAASAASVTVSFEGTVTDVFDSAFLDGSVQVGSPMSGSLTYPSTATDQNSEPGIGVYLFTALPAAFRLEVGAYVFQASWSTPRLDGVVIDDLAQWDYFTVAARPPLVITGPLEPMNRLALESIIHVLFRLSAPAPGPLSSDQLPPVAPLPADWPYGMFLLEDLDLGAPAPNLRIAGQITSFVPEPSSLLLFAGVFVLVGVRRIRTAGAGAGRRPAGAG